MRKTVKKHSLVKLLIQPFLQNVREQNVNFGLELRILEIELILIVMAIPDVEFFKRRIQN